MIPAGEVHVWCRSLVVSEDELAHGRSLLDERELERADRLRVPVVRRRFIAARAALRSILGEAIGADPAALRFTYGERGKPQLTGGGPHFNASDSGDWVVVALAAVELGVDVEVLRPLAKRERLARRICTENELATLSRVAERERDRAFLKLWTCKEAALKALGVGLPGGLQNIEVEIGSDEGLRLKRLCGDAEGWNLLSVELGPELECSVVTRGSESPKLRIRSQVGRSSATIPG